MTDSVTIGIATCGRPSSLKRCLQAVAAQTRTPDEIIVVEQAPTPQGREVVAASGLRCLRYFEQARIGVSASRNVALANAANPILAITDDDCMPDPGWIAGILGAFERQPEATAVTGPILAPTGEQPSGMYAISLRTSLDSRLFSERLAPWAAGSGGNFAARLASLREISGWDERLGPGSPGKGAEDCEIIDRLLSSGRNIYYESSAIVRHDWQCRDRRMSTRGTYAYGVGALCGLRFAERDSYGWRILAAYGRMHLRKLAQALATGNWERAGERILVLRALLPGCIYGFRARPRANLGNSATELQLHVAADDRELRKVPPAGHGHIASLA